MQYLDKPLLMFALFSISTQNVSMAFDRLLEIRPTTSGNYWLRFANRIRTMTAPVITGGNVDSPTTAGAIQVGPNVISYHAVPQEIRSRASGDPADPIVRHPLQAFP